MLKVCCWNINSIKVRLNQLFSLVHEENPDIILLQEIKTLEAAFPYESISDLGYNIAINGQKAFNGVAILSKLPLEDIKINFSNNPDPSQARFIEAVISFDNKAARFISIYVPNGQEVGTEKFYYKLEFLESFKRYLEDLLSLEEILIIGGDFNVANEDIDVYDPVGLKDSIGFNIEEQIRFRKILNLGFSDSFRVLNPDISNYSWWDYRKGGWQNNLGMRIDYILTSPKSSDYLIESYMNTSFRSLPQPSDHVPVICKLNL